MNITGFYSTIIEQEKEKFNIGNKSLQAAVRHVMAFNNPKPRKKRQSSSQKSIYNKPSCRCAYLYKYATINTWLLTKNFRKLAKRKDVKNEMHSKKSICCLGGGPGTDVVGIFKALAVNPAFNGRITEVSVLDVCSGWENMFNNVISGLLEGKLLDVPETFINPKKFSHKFIQVDLLESLPDDVVEIISSADIVCMSRFVSDILGDARSSNALKVLGNLLKLGALVLYVDVTSEKVFELTEDISRDTGLETVLNPLHEMFTRHIAAKKEVYGCGPQFSAEFSVVGWHKTSIATNMNTVCDDLGIPYDTESIESEEVYDSEDNNDAFDFEGYATSLDILDSEGTSLNGNSTSFDVLSYECNDDASEVLDTEGNDDALEVFDSEDNDDASEVLGTEDNSDALEVFHSKDSSDVLEAFDSKSKESLNKQYRFLVDSCTQTESNVPTYKDSSEKEDILALMKAVSNLLNVVEQWKQKHPLRKCCCCH